MVADLPRMGEWSPECQRVEWEDGATGPAEGARFVGHNRGGPRGLMRWSRRGRVLTADRDASSPSSPRRAAASPPSGATASSPSTGGHGSPSPTTCSWIPAGPASWTSPPTATASCSGPWHHTLAQLKTAAEASAVEDEVPDDHDLPCRTGDRRRDELDGHSQFRARSPSTPSSCTAKNPCWSTRAQWCSARNSWLRCAR